MSDLENEVDNGEQIGVIGSPSSSSKLLLDIMAPAIEKRLVGSISILKYRQNEHATYALGQITEVFLNNIFAQDPTMRSLIKQRGNVPPITGQQDTHIAEMLISAVFEENENGIEPSSFDTVPPTGTNIRLINQPIMDKLVEPYAKDIVKIGRVFGIDVLLPNWFRHFGPVAEGGIGDAMHIGIFGKTGSGKSFLAKMILMSYLRHEKMSILVLDPQGEFSKMAVDPIVKKYAEEKFGKKLEVYDLSHLVLLGTNEMFKKILIASGFIKKIGVKKDENQMDAADQIVRILEHRHGHAVNSSITGRVNIWKTYPRSVFDHVWERLHWERIGADGKPSHPVLDHIYTDKNARQRVLNTMSDADVEEFFQLWINVANLFGREDMRDTELMANVLQSIGERKKAQIVIINLSETNIPETLFWNETSQTIAINQMLERLVEIAKAKYLEEGELNAIVVLDEAHRFAPRAIPEENLEVSALRNTLRDAIRTTRKYKLGWMFISQTLASLDKEVINQLRMYFFGYGLAWGTELMALKEIIGGNQSAQHLYQQFKDPESSFKDKKYSFMSVGPSSPLSFSQIPLFFNSLQFPDEFLKENNQTGNENETQ